MVLRILYLTRLCSHSGRYSAESEDLSCLRLYVCLCFFVVSGCSHPALRIPTPYLFSCLFVFSLICYFLSYFYLALVCLFATFLLFSENKLLLRVMLRGPESEYPDLQLSTKTCLHRREKNGKRNCESIQLGQEKMWKIPAPSLRPWKTLTWAAEQTK